VRCVEGRDVDHLHDELSAFASSEWERLSGHSARDAAQLHAAFGHILRGYRYLELIHDRHVPTAKRYKDLLAQLFTKMDPAFDGGAITYDEEMEAMDAEMADLLDVAHLDLETFYLFAKTTLDRAAQYVELYFGPETKLPVRSHDKLHANLSEYAVRRGIVVPDGFMECLARVHDSVATHQSDSATNDARVAQSPSDLMIAHTEKGPGPNGTHGVTRLSLTTGQLLNVVDGYLRFILELIRQNPNRARMLRKRKTREAPAPQPAPEDSSRFSLPVEAPAPTF